MFSLLEEDGPLEAGGDLLARLGRRLSYLAPYLVSVLILRTFGFRGALWPSMVIMMFFPAAGVIVDWSQLRSRRKGPGKH